MRVDGKPYLLAQGQDVEEVKNAIVQATRSGGDFVTVTEFGNRSLDVLVTVGVPVTLESETVAFDPQDDGDLEAPFVVSNFDDVFFDHWATKTRLLSVRDPPGLLQVMHWCAPAWVKAALVLVVAGWAPVELVARATLMTGQAAEVFVRRLGERASTVLRRLIL
jgi:hypothetical protein